MASAAEARQKRQEQVGANQTPDVPSTSKVVSYDIDKPLEIEELVQAGVDQESTFLIVYQKVSFIRKEETQLLNGKTRSIEQAYDGTNVFIGINGNTDSINIGVSGSSTGDRLHKDIIEMIADPQDSTFVEVPRESWAEINEWAIDVMKRPVNGQPQDINDQAMYATTLTKLKAACDAKGNTLAFNSVVNEETGKSVFQRDVKLVLGYKGIDTVKQTARRHAALGALGLA